MFIILIIHTYELKIILDMEQICILKGSITWWLGW